jgi:hypothetical protein
MLRIGIPHYHDAGHCRDPESALETSQRRRGVGCPGGPDLKIPFGKKRDSAHQKADGLASAHGLPSDNFWADIYNIK